MLDIKYMKISEKQITCGQTSGGIWYCKELPAENTKTLNILIGEVNGILNKYNKMDGNKKPSTPPIIKGLK